MNYMGLSPRAHLTQHQIPIEITFRCDPVPGYQIVIKFCTCHDSAAVVSCAKFCCDLLVKAWIRGEWYFRKFVVKKLQWDVSLSGWSIWPYTAAGDISNGWYCIQIWMKSFPYMDEVITMSIHECYVIEKQSWTGFLMEIWLILLCWLIWINFILIFY